jgi:hypothetical protein
MHNKGKVAPLFLCAVLVTGCGSIPANITETSIPLPMEGDSGSPTQDREPGKVGSTWRFDDGVDVKLVKISRSTIPQISSGGSPGDPAVVVTVKITNGSRNRLDISLLSIKVRTGTNGDETEQSFAEGFSNPDGLLAKERSYTYKAMFAADKPFKKVAVDVTPTWDYSPAQFEGMLK